jgi:hypothetical protein
MESQEAAMKRLQTEFDELQEYKKLGSGDGHGHEDTLKMGDELTAVCTENAKLKYQLKALGRVCLRTRVELIEGSGGRGGMCPQGGRLVDHLLLILMLVLAIMLKISCKLSQIFSPQRLQLHSLLSSATPTLCPAMWVSILLHL